tara:strand:- start:4378 stop:4605 length:228 start_codon:yes stop_codon:yes gene_type:complete
MTNKLLNFLEDLVGQMQMGKIDDERALEIMANVVSPRITTIGDLQDKWDKERLQQIISNYPALAKAYNLVEKEQN